MFTASVQLIVLFCTSISPLYIPFLPENRIADTPSRGTNKKNTCMNEHQRVHAESGGKLRHSLPISSLTGRDFSIFRQKRDGPTHQKLTSKCLFLRRKFIYEQNNVFSIIGKFKNFLHRKKMYYFSKKKNKK